MGPSFEPERRRKKRNEFSVHFLNTYAKAYRSFFEHQIKKFVHYLNI